MGDKSGLMRAIESATGNMAERQEEIWKEFGVERAPLIIDSSVFSRVSATHGILHFLELIVQFRLIAETVCSNNNCLNVRCEADNVFADFSNVQDALNTAIETNNAVAESGLMLQKDEPFKICAGIGFGKLLDGGYEGLYGDEMNLASKL